MNRADILRQAWADYRRDAFKGWGVSRNGPFSREHFAYCLRMAWAVAKEQVANAKAEADRAAAPVATVLGAANLLDAVTAARVAEIDRELYWQELGDRIDWTSRRNLQAERAELLTA